MPRPRKCRKVCCLPKTLEFVPVNACHEKEPIYMTVDEYETIRLIDKEGFSQEECGLRMEVARTTIQQIYTSARKKLADALVDGRSLRIEGGQYRLCDENEVFCSCCNCYHHRYGCSRDESKNEEEIR